MIIPKTIILTLLPITTLSAALPPAEQHQQRRQVSCGPNGECPEGLYCVPSCVYACDPGVPVSMVCFPPTG